MNCLQVRVGFAQSDSVSIPSTWILLDPCSTSSVGCNADLIGPIRDCTKDEFLTVYTNGGQKSFRQVATLKLHPLDIYYNKNSMVNILSLKDVASIPGIIIIMNSTVERAILV